MPSVTIGMWCTKSPVICSQAARYGSVCCSDTCQAASTGLVGDDAVRPAVRQRPAEVGGRGASRRAPSA